MVRVPGAEYACETGAAPLDGIANAEKILPDEYLNAAGNDVTEAFIQYARPLIGGELPPVGRLARHPVGR